MARRRIRRQTTRSSRPSTPPGTSPRSPRGAVGLARTSRGLHLAHGRSLSAAAGRVQLAPRRPPQSQRAAARHAHQRAEETAARLREESARLAEFHARLLLYLQQVTAYIDTRDRRSAGGALVLNASLSGLAENMDKRWESLSVRDQRADARANALAAGQDELRAHDRRRAAGVALAARRGGRSACGPSAARSRRARASGGGAPRALIKADRAFESHAGCFARSTATSTSGSRISFADRATPSGRGSRATSRSLPAPPTSSMSAAGAASFSSCWPAPASVRGAST